jgi:hypothetical protein
MVASNPRTSAPAIVLVFAAALALGGCDRPGASPSQTPAPTTAADAATLARALASRMGPPPGGYKARRDAQGREILDLGGRFRHVTVVGTAPDGSMRLGCVSSPREAEALLTGALATTPKNPKNPTNGR